MRLNAFSANLFEVFNIRPKKLNGSQILSLKLTHNVLSVSPVGETSNFWRQPHFGQFKLSTVQFASLEYNLLKYTQAHNK